MQILTLMLIIALAVIACKPGQPRLRDLTNQELVGRRTECIRVNPTSPGMVTACENIRKECERRRKKGNYAC